MLNSTPPKVSSLAKPAPTTILEIAVKKKKDKARPRMTTSLSGHTRFGKTLVPPMMSLPGSINFSSWSNERLPEMLWAALVMTVFPREDALGAFREIASPVSNTGRWATSASHGALTNQASWQNPLTPDPELVADAAGSLPQSTFQ